MNKCDYVLGINLGIINTLACYMEKGKRRLLGFGFRYGESFGDPDCCVLLPSVLYVDEQGTVLVGRHASNRGMLDPQNLIRFSQTFLGDYEAKKTWVCRGRTFTPTDVATEILKEVRRRCFVERKECDADAKIGAVITVPAYFNSNQIAETRKAGVAAGFNVLQIITEPMAATVAVANIKKWNAEKKVFVVVLGNKTCDLSVLAVNPNTHCYTIMDSKSDSRLGGDDFDKALFDYLVTLIKDDTGRDFSSPQFRDIEYLQRRNSILLTAEQAKIDLSNAEEAEIDIFDLCPDIGYELAIRLSREDLNSICQGLCDKLLSNIHTFIEKNPKFRKEDVGEIILAEESGSYYTTYIQDAVYGFFQRTPQKDRNPSTLVVTGACLVANRMNNGLDIELNDVPSLSAKIDNLQKTNSELRKRIVVLQKENRDLQTILQTKQKELEDWRAKLKYLEEELYKRKLDLTEREHFLDDAEKRLHDREIELYQQKEALTRREEFFNAEQLKLEEREFQLQKKERKLQNVYDA